MNKFISWIKSLYQKKYSLKKEFTARVREMAKFNGYTVSILEQKIGRNEWRLYITVSTPLKQLPALTLELYDVKSSEEQMDFYLDPYMMMLKTHIDMMIKSGINMRKKK